MDIIFHPIVKTDYLSSMKMQEECLERVRKTGVAEVLFFEYPPLITLGKRFEKEDNCSVDLKDIKVYKVDRGGLATFHNPGQIVFYPILALQDYGLSVRSFVCILEKTVLEACKQLNIPVSLHTGKPGVYTEKGKISSVGIRVIKGISTHGVSVNHSNNLEQFSNILFCGEKQEFDKVSNYSSISFDEFTGLIRNQFKTMVLKSKDN